jgi:DNA-binding transcriptional regulator YbjK
MDNDDRIKGVEDGLIEVAMTLKKVLTEVTKHEEALIETFGKAIDKLTREVKVTDAMVLLVSKEAGISKETFMEIYETAKMHVVSEEIMEDMPEEVKETLNGILAKLNAEAEENDSVKH